MLVAAADVAARDPVVLTVLAFAQVASGQPDDAARTMASARGDAFHQIPRNIAWTFVMATAVETCVALRQREWCRELYGLLEPARWTASGRRLGGGLFGRRRPVPGHARQRLR